MITLKAKNGNIDLTQKIMKGDKGGYYIPVIDEEGNLTFIPSEDGMEPVEGANIIGPQGDAGIHVGAEEPTDEDMLVWVNPNGDVSAYCMTREEVQAYIDMRLKEVEYGSY
jgi:hypothetical protein